MPAQAATFHVFEAGFNPGSQAIPRHIGLLGGQISDHDPRMLIALFPLHQERATESTLLLGKPLHYALPLRPRLPDPATDPVKLLFSLCWCLDPEIDAQERM